jgi:hypothetical protein
MDIALASEGQARQDALASARSSPLQQSGGKRSYSQSKGDDADHDWPRVTAATPAADNAEGPKIEVGVADPDEDRATEQNHPDHRYKDEHTRDHGDRSFAAGRRKRFLAPAVNLQRLSDTVSRDERNTSGRQLQWESDLPSLSLSDLSQCAAALLGR